MEIAIEASKEITKKPIESGILDNNCSKKTIRKGLELIDCINIDTNNWNTNYLYFKLVRRMKLHYIKIIFSGN